MQVSKVHRDTQKTSKSGWLLYVKQCENWNKSASISLNVEQFRSITEQR